MKPKSLLSLFILLCIALTARAEQVNMLQAGAKADGKTLNTALINSTIERLNKAGGGTLFFPAGKYLTGAIHLKSNITLDLEAGATLLFSDNFDDYLPFVEMRHEGVVMKSFSPLIYAVDCENITIKGEGTLDGQGKAWWEEFRHVCANLDKDVNKYQAMWEQANDVKAIYAETNADYVNTLRRRFFRPPFIQPVRCKEVRIEGIKIVNSPFWTVNPEFCVNVTIKGITINNVPSPNTDGINPESCSNVHISDCHISVGDDCITIKSGRDLQGRKYGVPCENITITNCTMLAGHGGVVIGSEMSGSVRKVTISNCVFDGTDRGIRLKSTRGRGGVVEAIRVSNIVMSNIKNEAIILDLKYSKMPEEAVSERTPIFRNIHISGLTGVDVNTPIYIRGLEESPITDITLSDINLNSRREPVFEHCERIQLNNVIVNGKEIRPEACSAQTPRYENQFKRPLAEVLNDIAVRFDVKLKYDIDTVGKVLPYADFRIRPYSVEESLTNVLAYFDYKFTKQSEGVYKLKAYEYPRRTAEDGKKMLAYLTTLYNNKEDWEARKAILRKEVRERLGIDSVLAKCVKSAPTLSKIRKYDGYTVQNIAMETLPGLYVCGSIYAPAAKGKHPLIICPNGHFYQGRYRQDQQQRMATLARMGAVCIDYDLYGWGESALQVGEEAHRTSTAHVMQMVNGLSLLDYMLTRKEIDPARIGVNGGSGGGSQVVLLTVLDDRFTAACPVVSLASHFDGGCPCESGMPISLSGGGTNNAELMAMFAPRPVLVVSDGGDWTASVPTLEYPYLQYIYGFYGAADQVSNVHLPTEKHDFGPNKRNAVYDFFAHTFHLDKSRIDESKVTIEPEDAMYAGKR